MPRRTLALLTALSLLAGCAPYLKVQSREPGPVSVGQIQELVLVDGEGRRSAREVVFQEFAAITRRRGYFLLQDRSTDALRLILAGTQATVEGADGLAPGQGWVRLDVLEWDTRAEERTRFSKDDEGNSVRERYDVRVGTAVVAATLTDHEGHAILAERDYEGTYETERREAEAILLERAARDALAQLVEDITPRLRTTSVRIDDDDEALKPIIETARQGNVAQAAADLSVWLESHPESAAGWYDLAVFTDAMGEFDTALGYYDRAIELSGGVKSYYVAARAGCAKRLADREALQN